MTKKLTRWLPFLCALLALLMILFLLTAYLSTAHKRTPLRQGTASSQYYIIRLPDHYFILKSYAGEPTLLRRDPKVAASIHSYTPEDVLITDIDRVGCHDDKIIVETTSNKVSIASERARGISVSGKAFVVVSLKTHHMKVYKNLSDAKQNTSLYPLAHYAWYDHF